ncbi:hypothetical protein DS745_16790 [Anaerobacillus alkaliphilus]|uniref:Flagellar hook-length control protein-like C-terminal domain-containing protein n=1 Tax=Anaerobacillus alkaliphilus TaxID=1548597 RepID=A0A4V1LFZ7_9BACI|nr:flagellar hook-length control protein FliK [Anaerobacillus alkaliphilus]RXI98004.1 hypothetical protein DS745_16790 [Anaerobacillus alkaliphilus]
MNGINVVQGTVVQQMLGATGSKKSNSSFDKFFNSAMGRNDGAFLNTMPQLTKEEHVDLQTLLTQFSNQLSLDEPILSEEVMVTTKIEELLKMLAIELQVEIEDINQNSQDVVSLIREGAEYLHSPAHLIVLMTKLSKLTSLETGIDRENHTGSLLQKMLVQLKSILTEEHMYSGQKDNIDKQQFILAAYKAFSLNEPTSNNQTVLPSIQGLPLTQMHQLVLHTGEGRAQQMNEEQFLRQFQNILNKSTLVQSPNGMNKLTIKLFPQHLGRLDVTLIQQNGMIVAQLLTTTKAAKHLVEAQLHHLKQAFVNQNIQVEKVEVQTQQSYLQDRQNQEEQRNNNRNKGEKERSPKDDDIKFEDLLKEIDAKV